MRERRISFIVVSLLLIKFSVFGQDFQESNPSSIIEKQLLMHKLGKSFPASSIIPDTSGLVTQKKLKNFFTFSPSLTFSANFQPGTRVPSAFFCRQEIRLEKATGIAFRFRLGSVDYVDYLERKPNSVYHKR